MKNLLLINEHIKHNAHLHPFADYNMPMHYTSIPDEHNAVRNNIGLFDVSHMAYYFITGTNADKAIDAAITNNIQKIEPGRALYTTICNENGNILDDLIIYQLLHDKFLIISNASRINTDIPHFQKFVDQQKNTELLNISDEYVLLAIQGPKTQTVLQTLIPHDLSTITYFSLLQTKTISNQPIIIARTGYTGEDGFECLIENKNALDFFNDLLEAGIPHGLKLAGLGARDTLRLEAKLPLYGNDIDESTNPLEASLAWSVDLNRETNFSGKQALLNIKKNGIKRKLVGFAMHEKGIIRQGYKLYANNEPISTFTSGNLSPTLGYAIAMAYIPSDIFQNKDNIEFFAEIRNKRFPVHLTTKPFYKRP